MRSAPVVALIDPVRGSELASAPLTYILRAEPS
jgi:hypothetical protein